MIIITVCALEKEAVWFSCLVLHLSLKSISMLTWVPRLPPTRTHSRDTG